MEENNIEKRVSMLDLAEIKPEIKKLRGYAAVYNSLSEPIPHPTKGVFRELIKPGAFDRSLQSGEDVFAFGHHRNDVVLGRRSTGSLELRSDSKGLYFEISPPDTRDANDIINLVSTGHLDKMSFGFRVNQDKWYKDSGGNTIRELLDVSIFEISVVSMPSYKATEVAYRDIAQNNIEEVKVEEPAVEEEKEDFRGILDIKRKRLGLSEADN